MHLVLSLGQVRYEIEIWLKDVSVRERAGPLGAIQEKGRWIGQHGERRFCLFADIL